MGITSCTGIIYPFFKIFIPVSVKDTGSSIYSAFSFFPIACISYSYCCVFLHLNCSFVISMFFLLLFNVFCYPHSLCILTPVVWLSYVYFVAPRHTGRVFQRCYEKKLIKSIPNNESTKCQIQIKSYIKTHSILRVYPTPESCFLVRENRMQLWVYTYTSISGKLVNKWKYKSGGWVEGKCKV